MKAPWCVNDRRAVELGAHTVDWSGAAGGQEETRPCEGREPRW